MKLCLFSRHREGIELELLQWVEKNETADKRKLSEHKYFDTALVGGVCLVMLICGILYAALSKTVYFWDSSTYWDIGRMLAKRPLGGEFLTGVYKSICESDYNYLAALPVALWFKVFGVTRISYIACIITFYLIPVQIVTFLLAKRLCKAPGLGYIITVLIMPAVLYIVCIGFIDICAVLSGLLCYYLYFAKSESKGISRYVCLGFLLTFIMLLRRYFAFFSVSFATVMIIDCVLFKKSKKNLFITGISAVVLLAVFYLFLINVLLRDYGNLYSSYKYSFITDLKLITRYFGMAFLILIIFLPILLVIRKKDVRGLFALLQAIVCGAMFVSTQTHGQQHLLLYVPAFTVIMLLGINAVNSYRMLVTVCIVALLNIVSPMINRVQPQNIQEIKYISLVPTFSVKPQVRSDIRQVLALKRMLDKAIPKGSKCGILASSFTINSSILDNVMPSLNITDSRDDGYITGLPEVDSRDYWRLDELYNIDYILVTDPAQTHLSQSEQTIITQAVSSFKNKTDIAQSFVQVHDFEASVDGIKIKLYKREKEVSLTARTEFELRLFK